MRTVVAFSTAVPFGSLAALSDELGHEVVAAFHNGATVGSFRGEPSRAREFLARYQALLPEPEGKAVTGLVLEAKPDELKLPASLPVRAVLAVPAEGHATAFGPAAATAIRVRGIDGGELPKTYSAANAGSLTGQWEPASGRVEARELNGNREIRQTLTWLSQDHLAAFGTDWAYEHDFRLVAADQGAVFGQRPFCAGPGADDFWADRDALRDELLETNMPEAAEIYLDTQALDGCDQQDYTVGVFNPSQLEAGIEYWSTITTGGGDVEATPAQLQPQAVRKDVPVLTCPVLLQKQWCGNVNSVDDFFGGDPGIVVGNSGRDYVSLADYSVPGCRTWALDRNSAPCPSWSDDFNRSDRALNDNGWEQVLGSLRISGNEVRWGSYGASNFGGWYSAPTVAQRRYAPYFDTTNTDVVSVSLDATVETGKTNSGTALLFLFIGGFGNSDDFPADYDDGVYFQITDSGNLYLEQYNGLSTGQHYVPANDGIADYRDQPGVTHNFRLAFDPKTSVATAYVDGRAVMTLTAGGPMGPLVGFATDPEDYYSDSFGPYYFREWINDNFAVS